jgi:hypothetical protein
MSWHLTTYAVECYARILRGSRGAIDSYTDAEFARAKRRLTEFVQHAAHRQTDGQGRELWRCPESRERGAGLRWVVSYERRPEGPLPQVVWVGQGKPPERHWDASTARERGTRGPAPGTGGRPVSEAGATGSPVTWRPRDVDRERIARLRALWGLDSDAEAIRRALEIASDYSGLPTK